MTGRGTIPHLTAVPSCRPPLARRAAAGMTFTQVFVASPSCATSRPALLTGLDPMRNGAMLNHSRPRAEIRELLQWAG
ncbi:MAG: sulfatase-like hydrolase/transferase [Gemmataceae bacterium]|nr:sulfatase-like hydrolase/transferase [Gemmata sp.]MDW8198178.1 sulfatase-like hydrolase/transferase [Gemmataceae bacterium]